MLLINLMLSLALAARDSDSVMVKKAIREAENLSLAHDRILAVTVLTRNYKKVKGKNQIILKDKINKLSRFFYTDKGLQSYQVAKELYEKNQYSEALEKINDAENLEGGNVDVLYLRAQCELELKQYTKALNSIERSLEMNSVDESISRLKILTLMEKQDWAEAQEQLDLHLSQFTEAPAYTNKIKGIILIGLNQPAEAKKSLSGISQGENLDILFYLSKISEDEEKKKYLDLYLEGCKKAKATTVFKTTDPCRFYNQVKKEVEV